MINKQRALDIISDIKSEEETLIVVTDNIGIVQGEGAAVLSSITNILIQIGNELGAEAVEAIYDIVRKELYNDKELKDIVDRLDKLIDKLSGGEK